MNVYRVGGMLMKHKKFLKRKKGRKEVIRDAIRVLEELNPQIRFEEDEECISTSCKSSDELLQLKMPEGIVKTGDPEEAACYGFIYIKIGEETVSVNGCGIFSDS